MMQSSILFFVVPEPQIGINEVNPSYRMKFEAEIFEIKKDDAKQHFIFCCPGALFWDQRS